MSPAAGIVLEELNLEIRAALGDQLAGLYLFGSYATGQFEEGVSDLDLVAVLEREVDADEVDRLAPVHDGFVRRNPEWSNRLDIAYIGRATLATFRAGRGSFAVISPGEPFQLRQDVADWLLTWYLLRETSVPLAGVAASDVVPPIARSEFIAALAKHAEWLRWRSREERSAGALAYQVLTVCRVLGTVTTDADPSKIEAARWARERWPGWQRTIDTALQCRRSGGRFGFDDEVSQKAATRFIDMVANEIEAARIATGG